MERGIFADAFVAAEGRVHSAAPEETTAFGRQLAQALAPGDVVGLDGDLGAGKTCLIQGIAEGLGVTDVVSSPTFILLNIYDGAAGLRLYHFDLYRLTTADELEEIGATEFFGEPGGISLVEWANRLPEVLPAARWRLHLDHVDRGSGESPDVAQERIIRWQRPAGTQGEND